MSNCAKKLSTWPCGSVQGCQGLSSVLEGVATREFSVRLCSGLWCWLLKYKRLYWLVALEGGIFCVLCVCMFSIHNVNWSNSNNVWDVLQMEASLRRIAVTRENGILENWRVFRISWGLIRTSEFPKKLNSTKKPRSKAFRRGRGWVFDGMDLQGSFIIILWLSVTGFPKGVQVHCRGTVTAHRLTRATRATIPDLSIKNTPRSGPIYATGPVWFSPSWAGFYPPKEVYRLMWWLAQFL